MLKLSFILVLGLTLFAPGCKEERPPADHWDYRGLVRNDKPYAGWRLTRYDSTNYDIAADSIAPHSGKWGAHIFSVADSPFFGGGVVYHLEAELIQARKVRLYGWARTESANDASIWYWVTKEPNLESKSLGKQIFKGIEKFAGVESVPDYVAAHDESPIPRTTDWTKYSFVFEVPQDAAYCAFGIWMEGTGKIWLDDFRYEVVEKLPTDSSFKDRSTFMMKPKDLDFEHTE